MKFPKIATVAAILMTTTPALSDPCVSRPVVPQPPGIWWDYHHGDADHWSWNAEIGDALIQDNGWAYFDGDGWTRSNAILIQYRDLHMAVYAHPSARSGWCELPPGANLDIIYVKSWDGEHWL